MDELTQPQVVQAANQPGDTGSTASGSSMESGAGAVNTGSGGNQPFLTVRYNKQEKPLSREEAAVYAQKGMNYDKLAGRLKAAEEQIRELGGGTRESLKPITLGPGAQKGQLPMAEAEASVGNQSSPLRVSGVRDVQAVVDAQLGEFAAAHPEIDPAALPAPVISAWKRGVPLSEAYGAYRAREDQRRERAVAANAANAAASMGGAGFMGASTPQQISDDAIKAMSPGELDKNHARIWAYLTGKKA